MVRTAERLQAFIFLAVCVCSLKALKSEFFTHILSPTGRRNQKIAEYFWTVEAKETMVYYDKERDQLATPVVFDSDGKMVLRNAKTCIGTSRRLNKTEEQSVVKGDGSHRRILTINGGIPGPSIVVDVGTQVVVHVTNALLTESVTIHWHGIVQKGTQWMDGVPKITQCPISPGDTFTYRFIASPKGTHWYHSHLGTQRNDGLYGALIVLDPEETYNWESNNATFAKEFVMMAQDWSRTEMSVDLFESVSSGLWRYKERKSHGDVNSECYKMNIQQDGTIVSIVPQLTSLLVNGNGHYFPDRMNAEHPKKPFDTYDVVSGNRYKFRVINAAFAYSIQVSIDEHDLFVTASDGYEFSEMKVQYIIITPGERFDFYINATQKDGKYWIRSETLEVMTLSTKTPVQPIKHFSILRYNNADDKNLTTSSRNCSSNLPCKVFNCPYGIYPPQTGLECVHITNRTRDADHEIGESDGDDIFLNWVFSMNPTYKRTRSTVNGRRFVFPDSPPLTNPGRPLKHECNEKVCKEDGHCNCTHTLSIKENEVVQMVLYNFDKGGMPHPVHLHGYSFYVLKEGHPVYNEDGQIISHNPDLKCLRKGTRACIDAAWAEGHPVGLNTKNPVKKDTVMVAAGGYVVIRFKADNPGWWFFHCHVEDHAEEGMALLLKVGDDDSVAPPPKGFKTCGDFTFSAEEFDAIMTKTNEKSKDKNNVSGGPTKRASYVTIVYLLIISVFRSIFG